MFLLMLTTALAAAPAGYKETKRAHDCVLYVGLKEADGVVPVYAECRWPDVDAAVFDRVFSDWTTHDELFSTIIASDLVRKEGGASVVHQVHTASGISDREVILAGRRAEVDGGFRYHWTRTADALTVAKGNVATARSDGAWWIKAAEGGGIEVKYELSYDPGGSVPGFLVRWFQVGGVADVLYDLRTSMAARK